MAQGSVSQAQLKRDFQQLGQDLFNIDLQSQAIKQGTQHRNIATLQAAKVETQKEVVAKEVELQRLKAQGRRAIRGRY